MWPEALQRVLDRASTRARWIAATRALSVALLVSLVFAIARVVGVMPAHWALGATVVVVSVTCFGAVRRAPRSATAVAAAIEARTPAAKNLLITAAELVERQGPIRADVRAVVLRDAADAASRIDVVALFPARRTLTVAVAAALLWGATWSIDRAWMARAADVARGVSGAPSVTHVVVTVTPPGYSGRPATTVTDPERIDALAGSVLHVVARGVATHIDATVEGQRHALARTADGTFAGDLAATADGLLALQPFGDADAVGVRRVIAIAVTPDRSPVARIVTPGKDMFLTSAKAPIAVSIEATDDLALSSLRLTYTKVTGSGENFTFKNGEFPLAITRQSAGVWTATASMPIASLAMEPGDVLVYRAEVKDSLPGRAPVESDAFVIELLRRGESLAEGFAIDEEKDKYAISQQMIIVKTERLIAKKATMTAEAFTEEAQIIAAEQKKVRAEFVFMMGGEFEDASAATGDINEEEEAANEAELLAGRMQNNGRRDIINATRYMSDAAQLLTNINPVAALPKEKSALDALQRAFTKSRYILRVLTPRERIDDARRLSGKLNDAASWRRLVGDAPADPRAAALSSALGRVSALAGRRQYGVTDANALADLAEAVLRADSTLAGAAQAFTQAGASIAAGRSATETAQLIETASAKLAAALRASLPLSPSGSDVSRGRLRGAVADGAKRGGGR